MHEGTSPVNPTESTPRIIFLQSKQSRRPFRVTFPCAVCRCVMSGLSAVDVYIVSLSIAEDLMCAKTESHFTSLPRRVNVSLVERLSPDRQNDQSSAAFFIYIKVKKSCYSANLDEETVALQTDNKLVWVGINVEGERRIGSLSLCVP
jgi:hypothetical protein